CTILKIPSGFNENNLINWLKIIKPFIVHHQGHLREPFARICNDLRIQFISGIHFWTGVILLNPEFKNIDIIEHKNYHKPDPELNNILNLKHCTLYTVS